MALTRGTVAKRVLNAASNPKVVPNQMTVGLAKWIGAGKFR